MTLETKRDVFERVLTEWYDLIFKVGGQGNEAYGYCEFDVTLSKYEKDYDAALPDDLPVIPKDVSEYIKECKHRNVTLANTLCMEMRPESVRGWMAFKDGEIANGFDDAGYHRKQEIMAKAWVLGVWRVEETGEIVEMEEEK
ncbi:hypothetical protein [Lacticaseibacillus paracasei]|uniref:Phage protein n=1 Tax=Lacticaseibacillus paracasei TaxID=1597 RepID=A0A422M3C0_LACPA|nr:hypothetical protein [Lacticaseibacillus paracasei]RND81507.1 hypothetical protein FAM18157_01431 [Lacticaseibacillus paracasei]